MPEQKPTEPAAEDRAREDVRGKFHAAVSGSPDRYRVYAYRVKPAPKYDPHTPSYAARWDWVQVEDDLEVAVSALGAGLYRLDFREGSERVTSGMMQIDPSAVLAQEPPERDNGGGEVVALLRQMSDKLSQLEHAPPMGGFDVESMIQLATAFNPGPAATETALKSALDAFRMGMEIRKEMDPDESQSNLLEMIAGALLPTILGTGGAPARDAGTPPPQRRRRPTRDRGRRTPPPQRAGKPPPSSSAAVAPSEGESPPPPGDTTSTSEGPAAPDIEEAATLEATAAEFEEFIWQVENAIADDEDPDWWADYVVKIKPDLMPALNMATWVTVQQRVKGRPDFPGLNLPTATQWITAFLERVETLALVQEGADAESREVGAGA